MSTHNIQYRNITKFKTCLTKVATVARLKVRQKMCPKLKQKVLKAEVVDGKKKRRRDIDAIGFDDILIRDSDDDESDDKNSPSPIINNKNGTINDWKSDIMEKANLFFQKETNCDFEQFKEVRYILYFFIECVILLILKIDSKLKSIY